MNELMFARAIEFAFGDCYDDMAERYCSKRKRLHQPAARRFAAAKSELKRAKGMRSFAAEQEDRSAKNKTNSRARRCPNHLSDLDKHRRFRLDNSRKPSPADLLQIRRVARILFKKALLNYASEHE